MPTLTTSYVYFGAYGAHTRQPRATTSYGGFTPIPGLNPGPGGTLTSGTWYGPGAASATLPFGTGTLNFSFVNLTGCTEGPLNSFTAAAPPSGTVGTNPINVIYVYVPASGGVGPPIIGATIDAFNESIGSLVDNDFVTVSPDPGGTLTSEANEEGWVDTSSSDPTITADHPNIGSYGSWPTTPLFDQWVDLSGSPPMGLISGADLTPGEGNSVIALAFYKNPMVSKNPLKDTIKEYVPDKWRSKDWEKEHYKEYGDKGIWENPGKGWYEGSMNPGNVVDPGIVVELQRVQERLAKLEAQLQEQGQAFIKSADRPPVGASAKKKRRR